MIFFTRFTVVFLKISAFRKLTGYKFSTRFTTIRTTLKKIDNNVINYYRVVKVPYTGRIEEIQQISAVDSHVLYRLCLQNAIINMVTQNVRQEGERERCWKINFTLKIFVVNKFLDLKFNT